MIMRGGDWRMKIDAYLEGHPEAIEPISKDEDGERWCRGCQAVSNNLCDRTCGEVRMGRAVKEKRLYARSTYLEP